VIAPLRGSQFDPDVLDAFLEIQDDFYAIARSYWDGEAEVSKKRDYINATLL